MSTLDRAKADFDIRLQASFAGIPFGCQSAELQSGVQTSTEIRVGIGQRVIPIAPGLRQYPIEGYVTGRNARQLEQKLIAATHIAAAQTLVHPWVGRIQAVATSVRFSWKAEEVEFVSFSATFAEATFPASPAAPVAAQSADEALEELSLLGADFAAEPLALVQWQSAAPDLLLDDELLALEDEAFAEAATRQALSSTAGATGEIPSAVQRVGGAVRSAEAGELTKDAWRTLDRYLVLLASRYNSPTLWAYRHQLAAYLGPFGAGGLANVVTGQGQSLQAIAVGDGVSPDRVARRNRNLAGALFARGELRR